MRHDRLVAPLLAIWCMLVAHVAANAGTFNQDMVAYDYRSLVWAATVALLGGVFRTIISLATDARPVLSVLHEAWRDALVSLLAGGAAFIGIEALRSMEMAITSEVRFAMILSAGVWRMSFFIWARNAVREIADAWKNRLKPHLPDEGPKQ